MKSLPYLSKAHRKEIKNAIRDEAEAVIEKKADLSDSANLDYDDERDQRNQKKNTNLLSFLETY